MKRKFQQGFIVEFWAKVFEILNEKSVFNLVKIIVRFIINNFNLKFNAYIFSEIWVIFNLILSFISIRIMYNSNNKLVIKSLTLYGVIRVGEIIVYQINVILFDQYRSGKKYKISSYTRSTILLIHNFIEIIFWYSSLVIFMLKMENLLNPIKYSLLYYVKMNILCLFTFNLDYIVNMVSKSSNLLHNIAFFEVITGLLLTLIVLAHTVGKLPTANEAN